MLYFTQTAAIVLAAVPAVLAQSTGCGKAPISSGSKTISVGGQQRNYIVKVPANYNRNKQYRLVFAFHGLFGSSQQIEDDGFYGLEDMADNSAIFVAPNGINTGWENTGGRDIAFVDQMIETIEGQLCVDTEQRFSTGFSYGGAMTYALACARADVFKAVAVISGAELSGCDGGNDPVPYFETHGVADRVLPIDSGAQLRDHFLKVNGCTAKNAPSPAAGSGSHIKTEYKCTKAPTVWIAHSRDHVPDPQTSDNIGPWLPEEIWNFWDGVS